MCVSFRRITPDAGTFHAKKRGTIDALRCFGECDGGPDPQCYGDSSALMTGVALPANAAIFHLFADIAGGVSIDLADEGASGLDHYALSDDRCDHGLVIKTEAGEIENAGFAVVALVAPTWAAAIVRHHAIQPIDTL